MFTLTAIDLYVSCYYECEMIEINRLNVFAYEIKIYKKGSAPTPPFDSHLKTGINSNNNNTQIYEKKR